MNRISSGKRYAQAAFELALERKELESWQEGLKKMADITSDQELMSLLENPRLPFSAKKTLLQTRLGEMHPLILNLGLLLVKKGILGRSHDILQKFNALVDAHQGIERAQVTTALPLGEEEKKTVSHRLGEIVHRNVVMEGQVDPSIIGGFVARMGDTLIDGSLRQKLESLKKSMIEGGR
jgi:F-type H+-transporting ATPase subunit delta